jgi:hypothetical protein
MFLETAGFPDVVFALSSVNLSVTPQVQVFIGVADTNLCCQITDDKAGYGCGGEAACQCKARGSVASKMTVRITTTPNFGHRPAPLAMSTDLITSWAAIGGGFATALQNLLGGIAEAQTVLSLGDHHAAVIPRCCFRLHRGGATNVCERSATSGDRAPTR